MTGFRQWHSKKALSSAVSSIAHNSGLCGFVPVTNTWLLAEESFNCMWNMREIRLLWGRQGTEKQRKCLWWLYWSVQPLHFPDKGWNCQILLWWGFTKACCWHRARHNCDANAKGMGAQSHSHPRSHYQHHISKSCNGRSSLEFSPSKSIALLIYRKVIFFLAFSLKQIFLPQGGFPVAESPKLFV